MDPTKLSVKFIKDIQANIIPGNPAVYSVYVMKVLEIPASMVPRNGDSVTLEGPLGPYPVEKVLWLYEGFLSPCVHVILIPDCYQLTDIHSKEEAQKILDSYTDSGWEILGEGPCGSGPFIQET